MLKRLLELLETGPLETTAIYHGANVSRLKNVRISAADEVGVVMSVQGSFKEYGPYSLYPWPAITVISIPQ